MHRHAQPSPRSHVPAVRRAKERGRDAFTLVELMVVIVIISIVASLSLAGLAGSRQRTKADRTRSTIRKIDAIIRPMYDSFRTRRVATGSISAPTVTQCPQCFVSGTPQGKLVEGWKQLKGIRTNMAASMPDSMANISSQSPRSYTAYKNSLANLTPAYDSAESLFMVVARSGFEPDALENFRSDEIGDIDLGANGIRGDGAKEFWDGWGRPIAFKLWAAGWVSDLPIPDPSIPSSLTSPRRTLSPIQIADKDNMHDPFDPLRLDVSAYALVPLIYSPGPDESSNDPDSGTANGYGLENVSVDIMATCNVIGGVLNGTPKSGGAYRDNITNHDLSRK